MRFIYLYLFLFLIKNMQVNAIPLKVPTEIYRGSADKHTHPGHYPFISYLTFRNICDHVIADTTEWFDPEYVKEGDTIYLNIWYLDWFVGTVHDQIKAPYILVSGDVGPWYPTLEHKKLLYDPKLTAWFCRNMVFSYHPKLFQIPMGQDLGQFILDDPKITLYLLEATLNKPAHKTHLLYMCHFPRKHGERDKLVKQFENEPYVLTRNKSSDETFVGVSRSVFYHDMATCQFVLSPLGLETDSVRTWEALVLDSIPIVEHTFLDPSYDKLPVVMVHDWSEVTPPFLEKKYEELKNRKRDEAYFDYWFRLVKNYQNKVRLKDFSHCELESTQFKTADLEDFFSILNKNGASTQPLFYKGFLCALRPLQIANNLDSNVYLFDPYLDQDVFQNLNQFIKDPVILKNQNKIHLFSNENEFWNKSLYQASSYFLDLTYYRTSLFVNFSNCAIEYGNWRQSLKNDLTSLYNYISRNSLLFGNMANNEYVKEVLDMFAKENKLVVETQGTFWFLTKK